MLIAAIVLLFFGCAALCVGLCIYPKGSVYILPTSVGGLAMLVSLGLSCASLNGNFGGFSAALVVAVLPYLFTVFEFFPNEKTPQTEAQNAENGENGENLNQKSNKKSREELNEMKYSATNLVDEQTRKKVEAEEAECKNQAVSGERLKKETQSNPYYEGKKRWNGRAEIENTEQNSIVYGRYSHLVKGGAVLLSAVCVSTAALFVGKQTAFGVLFGIFFGLMLGFLHLIVKRKQFASATLKENFFRFVDTAAPFVAVGLLAGSIFPVLLASVAAASWMFFFGLCANIAFILLQIYYPNKYNQIALYGAFFLYFIAVLC